MSLSENIRFARLAKGYTQEQLASLLGVSAQAVSKWETSETYPDGTLLVPLSDALDVSLDALFGHERVCLKELAGDIKRFLASFSKDESFDAARELCWQIEKGIFNFNMAIEEPYDPEELKRLSGASYILDNAGFTYVSNEKAPFFLLVPEHGNSFSEVIGDGEELRQFFAALSSPDTMHAVLFLHRMEPQFLFEKELLAKECGIGEERLDQVVIDLCDDLRLIVPVDVEIDGEKKTLFHSEPSHLLIALFLLAKEIIGCRNHFCYQSHSRTKPFLSAE